MTKQTTYKRGKPAMAKAVDRTTPALAARRLIATAFVRAQKKKYARAIEQQFRDAAKRVSAGLPPVGDGDKRRWHDAIVKINRGFVYPLVADSRRKVQQQFKQPAKRAGKAMETPIGMGDEHDFILPARRQNMEGYINETSNVETSTSAKRIDAIYQRGLREGTTPDKMARQLVNAGITESATRAEMLARTTAIWSSNEGTMQAYKAEGVTVVAWLATEDDVTCEFCANLDGRMVSVEQPFVQGGTRFGGLDGGAMPIPWNMEHPPVHPNCRCTIVSVETPEDAARIAADGEELRAGFVERGQGVERTADVIETGLPSEPVVEANAEWTWKPATTEVEADQRIGTMFWNTKYDIPMTLEQKNMLLEGFEPVTRNKVWPKNASGAPQVVSGLHVRKPDWQFSAKGMYDANLDRVYINANYVQFETQGMAGDANVFQIRMAQRRQALATTEHELASNPPAWRVDYLTKRKAELNKAIKATRWSVSTEVGTKATATHEMAHAMYFRGPAVEGVAQGEYISAAIRGGQFDSKWKASARSVAMGDRAVVSEYATEKPVEFFAEAYTAREYGITIPQVVIDALERVGV